MKIITRTLITLRKRNPITYRETVISIKVMSPLVLILLLALYFNEFVVTAIERDVAISGAILSTSLYGTLIILQRLRSAQQDFRIIERFGQEAQAGVPMKQLLEEPWIRDRYVRHYLKHIAETGGTLSSQLDQNAIESELHALQGDYDSKLEFPQFLVGFMIAMGLLGTFIGLLETLTGISDMLGGMSSSTATPEEQFKGLVSELRKPLAGMGIAFAASMFGLITSLMLSIMMTNLRHFISQVVMHARNVMHDLTEITRKALPHHPTDTTLAMLDNDEENGISSRQKGNILLTNRMDLVMKKLELLFTSVENSISSTARLNDLLGFGPRMKQTAERTLEELRSVASSNLEQQRIMQQMADSQILLINAINSILDTQRRSQADLATSFRLVGDRVGAIEKANVESGKYLYEIKENFNKFGALHGVIETISSVISRQGTLFEELIGEERGMKDLMALILDTQRRSQSDSASASKVIGEHVNSIEYAVTTSERHLYEVKEVFTKFDILYGMVEMTASGVNHQNLLFEELINETRGIKDWMVAKNNADRNKPDNS